MQRRLEIAVVGYGSGGQAAALMLARDGHRVTVFERVARPGPVGAGFLLQPVGLRVMWELGLMDQACRHGAPIRRLLGQTAGGRAVMDIRYRELEPRLLGLGMQRGTLFQLLDAEWTDHRCLRAGCEITDVDVVAGRLTDAAGHVHGAYDLIVVADGSASRLRRRVAPPRLDRAYPWGALWCLVPHGDWPWADELQQRYVAARRMVGMLPVGTRPDDPAPRLSFFWSLPAASLDAGIRDAGAWRRAVAAVWPEAERALRDTRIPVGLAAARYRDVVQRNWCNGRAVLLGDAAHAMSPQLGQGVNMALLDAMVLRDALRGQRRLEDALAAYQQSRRRHLRAYHRWSRWLTPLFQSDRRLGVAVRDACFHRASRWPGARGQMLRVLTGTRVGWFGTMDLPEAFLEALHQRLQVDARSPMARPKVGSRPLA